MARKTKEPKRKRQSIPAEVYKFVENLENFLEVDAPANPTEMKRGSHFVTSPSRPPSIVINTPSDNMIQEAPPNPFIDFPAMELLDKGLDNVDASTLRRSIDPIWKALESLDAMAMLNLTPTEMGARVTNGVCCKPIHDEVTPVRHCEGSTVRYVHISEVPDKYSVGIFIFPPHARIPLHDHPHMCVLSRVLYGDLRRQSLDLVRDEHSQKWFPSSLLRKLPHGSRRAILHQVDYLQAPNVTALYPYEGQLHEFYAGPNGAAVLDVLLPPYDEEHERDCTFYNIVEDTTANHDTAETTEQRLCWIVPTEQPSDFHCLSGRYCELGGDFVDSDDLEH